MAEETLVKVEGTVPGEPALQPQRRRCCWRHVLTTLVLLYAVAVVVLWFWLRFQGDRGWAATIVLFGPRWICALPLLLLVPVAAIWRRPLLCILIGVGLVIVGPIMGFRVHLVGFDQPYTLRLLTCNVDQSQFRAEQLAELIAAVRPDIVALQEVPGAPPEIVWPNGWYVVHRDELLVASRFPVVAMDRLPRASIPGKLTAIRYEIQVPNHEVQLFNLHLLSPRRGLEAVLDSRRGLDTSQTHILDAQVRARDAESRLASDWIARFPGAKIVAGDFNMPVDSAIYRESWSWLDNAFSNAGFGFGFTKKTNVHGWTYGSRIDHVLYSPPWRAVRAWVGPDIGSDHRPLMVDLD